MHAKSRCELQKKLLQLQASLEASEERMKRLHEENARLLESTSTTATQVGNNERNQCRIEAVPAQDGFSEAMSYLVIGDSIVRHVDKQNSGLKVKCFSARLKDEAERSEN